MQLWVARYVTELDVARITGLSGEDLLRSEVVHLGIGGKPVIARTEEECIRALIQGVADTLDQAYAIKGLKPKDLELIALNQRCQYTSRNPTIKRTTADVITLVGERAGRKPGTQHNLAHAKIYTVDV